MDLDATDSSDKKSQKSRPRPIYLDNNATTPMDPAVLAAMRPYLEEEYGNSASQGHSFGWKAQMAVDAARKQVAQLLQAEPREVFWTSGATESNNIVIQGVALKNGGTPTHVITSAVEHKSVLETCVSLRDFGVEVTVLPVNSFGQVEPDTLRKHLKTTTRLVSIMAANNEVGTFNPIAELAKITKQHNALFHCDAAQALGKIKIDLTSGLIDFLSFSGHKIYGPKGVGGLYIRKGSERFLRPLLFGGAQEKGIRPGTINVAGVVGMGKACELAAAHAASENERLRSYQRDIIEKILAASPEIILNGHPTDRLANNVSFSFKNIPPDSFALGLSGLAYSSGSACNSGSAEPSHVLQAMGVDPITARSTVRLGLGRFTSSQEVERTIEKLLQFVRDN